MSAPGTVETGPVDARSMAVIALGGEQLNRPHRSGDCTCLFCGLFRSHHYWVRAVLATAVVPGLLWLAHDVDLEFARRNLESGPLVGLILLVATAAAALALSCWYQPARRLVHIRRPRSTVWPPPS